MEEIIEETKEINQELTRVLKQITPESLTENPAEFSDLIEHLIENLKGILIEMNM
jgi:hypothetical protein